MDFVELSKSDNKTFAQHLYTSSFPNEERREFSQVLDLLPHSPFIFYVVEEKQQPIAILVLWHFDTFSYIEHLAVANEGRNKGNGTKIISHLITQTPNPVVLEVEPPFNETSFRRIKFYERLGFVLLSDYYLQLPYSSDKQAVEMRLMVSDAGLLAICDVESTPKVLYSKVYFN